MNIITTDILTKIYNPRMKKGGITALDEVSINIEQGEIFGLLGPNGAGKTTLFKVLLGITKITSGEAYLNGLPPSNPNSRSKVGYLPENHRFPEYLTGLQLIELTARSCGISSAEFEPRATKLLSLVDMSRWADTKLKKYSKGMMQRIGIAQAMINDPDVLFLDEPTDGVDPVGKAELKEVMKQIREEGKTIILNSHLLSEVESIADRVAILQRGKLAKIGSVEQLTSRQSQYQIEAEFNEVFLDIPENIGQRISIARDRMVVELKDNKDINWIIDQIRAKNIPIISVKPTKISLEQSFIETVTDSRKLSPVDPFSDSEKISLPDVSQEPKESETEQ